LIQAPFTLGEVKVEDWHPTCTEVHMTQVHVTTHVFREGENIDF
jgi:hypothetical protein